MTSLWISDNLFVELYDLSNNYGIIEISFVSLPTVTVGTFLSLLTKNIGSMIYIILVCN